MVPPMDRTLGGGVVVSSWLSVGPLGLEWYSHLDWLRFFQFLWLGLTMVMGPYLCLCNQVKGLSD